MIDTFVPYFKAGLENKEFCLWVVPDLLKKEEALELLREALPDFDHYLAQESIEVVAHDEWFFKQGTFDVPTVINRLSDKSREALSRGYAGLRVNKSSAWLYKEDPRQFTAFEKELDALIANERLIMLCTFSLQASGANEVLDAARAHQLTAARRNGAWEVIETAEIKRAVTGNQEAASAIDAVPRFRAFDGTRTHGACRDGERSFEQGRRSNSRHRATHDRISSSEHHAKARREDDCRPRASGSRRR